MNGWMGAVDAVLARRRLGPACGMTASQPAKRAAPATTKAISIQPALLRYTARSPSPSNFIPAPYLPADSAAHRTGWRSSSARPDHLAQHSC